MLTEQFIVEQFGGVFVQVGWSEPECTRHVDRDPPADGVSSGFTRCRGTRLSVEIDISRLIVAGVVRMQDLPIDTVLHFRPEFLPTR